MELRLVSLLSIGIVPLVSAALIYIFAIVVYRLYFHPLSKFPGSKIAAATQLYEAYHDLYRGGQYTYVIGELHKKYGPIIRISPDEIHISDPEFYDSVYTNANNPRDKWQPTADLFGIPSSLFATCKADLHRARRAPLNQFFSRRAILQLSPVITKHVDKLCAHLSKFKKLKQPASLKSLYGALTLDVVTEYSFAQSYSALDLPDLGKQWADSVETLIEMSYVSMYFPIVAIIMNKLPFAVVKTIAPASALMIDFQQGIRTQIIKIMDGKPQEKPEASTLSHGNATIFHELLRKNALPPGDCTIEHLRDEGQLMVAAGQLTTASHLQVTTYQIISNPHVLSKLREELKTVMPDIDSPIPSIDKLETLPYLSAVVYEGHRFVPGVAHRAQRISPQSPIIYGDYVIPPGTPVGMSALLQHRDEGIYSSPLTFDPERFIEDPSLKRHLVHFSRGTRACLGQNLANAELFMTLAAVFRRFDLELAGTTPMDVDIARDFIVPVPAKGAKGLTVLVK